MNSSNVKPYTNYLLIDPVERKQVLVADSKKLQAHGKVLAIGEDVKYTKVGDIVAFEMWDKPETEIDGITYHLVKETDALFRIEMP